MYKDSVLAVEPRRPHPEIEVYLKKQTAPARVTLVTNLTHLNDK